MQQTLDIASEFYQINNIDINTNKTISIVLNDTKATNFQLKIKHQLIQHLDIEESERYLGIYLNHQGIKNPTMAIINREIVNTIQNIKRKAITDKQAHYIIHSVLYPIIEYRSQATYLPSSMVKKWDTMIRNAFRKKTRLAKDHPLESIHHPDLYNLKSIEDLQAESKITNMIIRINTPGITQEFAIQQVLECQLIAWNPNNHLTSPTEDPYLARNHLIAGISTLLHHRQLHITIPKYPMSPQPNTPTIQEIVTKEEYCKLSPYLKKHHILYKHQITSINYPSRLMGVITNISHNNQPTSVNSKPRKTSRKPVQIAFSPNTFEIYTDSSLKHTHTL